MSDYGYQKNTDQAWIAAKQVRMRNFFMKQNGNRKRIVFGYSPPDAQFISWMFYSNDLVYGFLPSQEELNILLSKGQNVAVCTTARQPLPNWIADNPKVEKIELEN